MLKQTSSALFVVTLLLGGCGADDDTSSGDNNDCRGSCPTTADADDAEAACAELGEGKAYCFKQNGSLDTSVNCSANGGYALSACLNGKVCNLNADNSEAACE